MLTGRKLPSPPEPPRCAAEQPVIGFEPLSENLFKGAPSPLILPQGADWGDGPTVIAAARNATENYNAQNLKNIKDATDNRGRIIDAHNEAVEKRNAVCDNTWDTWRKAISKYKSSHIDKFID